jgi:hypothetical protein
VIDFGWFGLKSNSNIQSFRPSDFTPASGRAVAASRADLERPKAEALGYLEARTGMRIAFLLDGPSLIIEIWAGSSTAQITNGAVIRFAQDDGSGVFRLNVQVSKSRFGEF